MMVEGVEVVDPLVERIVEKLEARIERVRETKAQMALGLGQGHGIYIRGIQDAIRIVREETHSG